MTIKSPFLWCAALLIPLALQTVQASPVESVNLAGAMVVSSAPQAGIKDLVEKGQYKQAIAQWSAAYGDSEFFRSPTGQALYDLVLFRSDLQIIALERLFEISNPKMISVQVKTYWTDEIPFDHEIWRDADISFTSAWRNVFPVSVEDSFIAWRMPLPRTSRDFKNAQFLLGKMSLDNPARAWLLWHLGLGSTVAGQNRQAEIYFHQLAASGQTLIPRDQINLALGRLYYQESHLDKAMDSYEKIPKNSDYWLEATEEKAWTDARNGDFAETLSRMKTLTVPFFTSQLGPEPYYLWGLSAVRICDYASVFQMLKTFKERFKNRVGALQTLAATGTTPSATKALGQLETNSTIDGLGDDLANLPRFYQRDEELNRLASQARLARTEINGVGAMLAVDPQNSELDSLKFQGQKDYQRARTRSQAKMKVLARIDMAELSRILKKLHVVEVEAIQRMFPHQSLSKNDKNPNGKVKEASGDQLVFPQDGEVWLDELSHYQVKVKGCPVGGG
jgi:tetratricopeptide (TPR) repeat protein